MNRTYPEAGEEWSKGGELYFAYIIHSRTTDGWVRYYSFGLASDVYPIYCMPTDEFMKRYQKVQRG